MYLGRKISNDLFQMVLSLVLLKTTIPKAYVSVMKYVLYDSYDALEEDLNHLNGLKFKIYLVDNVVDFCAEMLVDSKCLERARYFNTKCLGYILIYLRMLMILYFVFG